MRVLSLLALLAAASAFVAPRAASFASVARAGAREATVMRLSKGDAKRRIKLNEAVWHASTKEELLTDEIATLIIKTNPKCSRKMIRKVRDKAYALDIEIPAGWADAPKRT